MNIPSMDDAVRKLELEQNDLAACLSVIPGGRDLIDWFEGVPSFHDAEIISLSLDRRGSSFLRIAVDRGGKDTIIAFELSAWIDAEIRGFSHQNVIEGLKLRHAEERKIQPWELGVGCQPGSWIIELDPCFGAYGSIRADIARIVIESGRIDPRRRGKRRTR